MLPIKPGTPGSTPSYFDKCTCLVFYVCNKTHCPTALRPIRRTNVSIGHYIPPISIINSSLLWHIMKYRRLLSNQQHLPTGKVCGNTMQCIISKCVGVFFKRKLDDRRRENVRSPRAMYPGSFSFSFPKRKQRGPMPQEDAHIEASYSGRWYPCLRASRGPLPPGGGLVAPGKQKFQKNLKPHQGPR